MKIFGPVKENGLPRNRTNQQLMGMCTELDISEIRKASLTVHIPTNAIFIMRRVYKSLH
jgi:hypothetical protein